MVCRGAPASRPTAPGGNPAAVFPLTGKITSAIQFSMLSAIPRPLQLAGVSLAVTTDVKSAALPDGQMALYGIAGFQLERLVLKQKVL